MKKLISVFILSALLVFTLTACSGTDYYENLSGIVVDMEKTEDYKYPVYTIATDENHTVKVTLSESGYPYSWIDVDGECLVNGDLSSFGAVKLEVGYDKTKVKKSSDEIIVVDAMGIDEVLYKNVKTLSDGTPVDMWDSGYYVVYQLSDGTELLRDSRPKQLDLIFVASTSEAYCELSEKAQNRILEFYNEKGLLFDVMPYLEQMYGYYKEAEDKTAFNNGHLDVGIVASGANDKVVHFVVMVHNPLTAESMTESRYGVTFDRTTGEFVDFWSMFNCDQHQVKETVVGAMWKEVENISDKDLKDELIKQFKPEYLTFWDDGVELSYPAGTLSGVENSYTLASKAVIENCTEEIYAIMQPWAVPQQTTEE